MGLEVCATLGMLNETQAKQLKEAGLTAYNHNLDTSREYYPKVGRYRPAYWHDHVVHHHHHFLSVVSTTCIYTGHHYKNI